jgi:hypothetical protein
MLQYLSLVTRRLICVQIKEARSQSEIKIKLKDLFVYFGDEIRGRVDWQAVRMEKLETRKKSYSEI